MTETTKKKKTKRTEGERHRVELHKGKDVISLSASPQARGGYVVQARKAKDGIKSKARPSFFFGEDAFDKARAFIEGQVKIATEKGWTVKAKPSVEELFD